MSRFCVYLGVFCVMCCRFSVLSYPQGAQVRIESCVNLQPVHADPVGSKPEGHHQTLPDPGQSAAVPDLYHHPAMRAAATER